MTLSKTLRRPSNWQDFETLCKKLWGEIWNCTDIRKNGRNGNNQYGVDIYGIPSGEIGYYGIQCKGKDEYTDKQFTEEEINEEIKKAKSFKPKLKKLYFATTAVKNADIEEFVRIQNIANIKKKLFGIELYAWEDIVELIDENKRTHDWYVKNQNYKTQKSISVSFEDNAKELICKPKFKQVHTSYHQKIIPAQGSIESLFEIINPRRLEPPIPLIYYKTTNLSYFGFQILLHNTGLDPIEQFKLLISIKGEILDLNTTNSKNHGIFEINYPSLTTFLNRETNTIEIKSRDESLVGDDTILSDDIFIKTPYKKSVVELVWKLISKDFRDHGILRINVCPDLETVYKEILVEDPFKVGSKVGPIQDYIIKSDKAE